MASITFEIERRIHHMFQHTRPGERAFLGHMPHQHQGKAASLGQPDQFSRASAHLRHCAGRGIQRI